MTNTYKGTAKPIIMEPLLRLASAPSKLRLPADDTGTFSGLVGEGHLTLEIDDPVVQLTWRDKTGEVVRDPWLRAWGDENSDSYWFPFGHILFRECVAPDGSSIDLTETIRRTRELLARVTFVEDENAVAPPGSRAAAAMNYLRLRSRVTDEWTIALAAPFELRLDDDSIGEGHGLLLEFGELPPGLDELGEYALVELESGVDEILWLHPVMCVFDEPCAAGPQALGAARAQLQNLGFSEKEIARLDAIAARVSEEYEWETDAAA